MISDDIRNLNPDPKDDAAANVIENINIVKEELERIARKG